MIIRNILYIFIIYIIYVKFEGKNMNRFVDSGDMVFVGDTSDWCVTCKFDKIVDLYCIRSLDMFQRKITL